MCVISISKLLDEQEFHHNFQPIYNTTNWRTLGYEVLFRSRLYVNPEEAFKEARNEKKLYELDTQSIHKALFTYQEANYKKENGYLFLNVFPSTILNPNFQSFLNKIITEELLNSQQIVFELSEIEFTNEFSDLAKSIQQLQELGILIAIDDIGKGYSNLQTVIELSPNFLKLDRFFTKELTSSQKKQRWIKHFLDYAEEFESDVILEGLETEIELATAKALGVPYGQGYILGRPDFLPTQKLDYFK